MKDSTAIQNRSLFFDQVLDLIMTATREIKNNARPDLAFPDLGDYLKQEFWSSAFITMSVNLENHKDLETRQKVLDRLRKNICDQRRYFKAYKVS